MTRKIGLLMLAVFLVSCAGSNGTETRPEELLPAEFPLPAVYEVRLPAAGQTPGPRPVQWTRSRPDKTLTADPLCQGPSVRRRWTVGGEFPGVSVHVCQADSAEAAQAILDRDPTGLLLGGPDYNADEAVKVPASRLQALAADDIEILCGLRRGRVCDVWLSRGRYQAFLVSISFFGTSAGGIDEESFLRMVRAHDLHVAETLHL